MKGRENWFLTFLNPTTGYKVVSLKLSIIKEHCNFCSVCDTVLTHLQKDQFQPFLSSADIGLLPVCFCASDFAELHLHADSSVHIMLQYVFVLSRNVQVWPIRGSLTEVCAFESSSNA